MYLVLMSPSNLMMNMKNKILTVAVSLLMLGTTSCTDFLDQTSESEYTSDVVFSTPAYTESAIRGIYAILTLDETYSSRMSLMYSVNSDIEISGADEKSYNTAGNRGISNYYASPSWSGHLDRTWKALYKGIERANLAIREIPLSPAYANPATANQMKGFLGEALTLRALFYFELVRHWGDVPYKTEPTASDGTNFYPAVVDRDTILSTLVKDLQNASSMMNWGTTPERISKGFSLGLMARICLARGGYSLRNKEGYPMERPDDYLTYYRIANEACREIMHNGPHSLNPEYVNIFKKLCALETETSYFENLFEVGMGLSRSSEIGYSIGVRFRTNSKYGFGNNANVISTTPYYFYQFDRKDKRRDVSVACYAYSNSAGDKKEIFTSDMTAWTIGKYDQRWMSEEFSAINIAATSKIGSGINWVMMRYADVLLMFAETENELNGAPTGEAKEALKEVRRRAFNAEDQQEKVENYVNALSSKEDFFNAIVDERMYEFGGEAIRKYDLIRWNLLSEKIEAQRTALRAMINGEAPYEWMPKNLHVKYKADGEILDLGDINFYEEKGETQLEGYEKPIAWMAGFKDTDKTKFLNRVSLFSSGLNSVIPNRYIFPIYGEIVQQSNGTLSNSYGY